MQIDFHHGVVYVLARLAGFSRQAAGTIAACSQYVDDATRCEPVRFTNGAIYNPICSAHKMLDYRNFNHLAAQLVWVPFHFLPGNNMLPAGEGEDREFVTRLVCRPDSPLAGEMVSRCILSAGEKNSLHRLGITLHVYADTWAHQGFAGIQSHVNSVQYLTGDITSQNLLEKVSNYFTDCFDRGCSRFIDGISPLGHGAVLSYPDRSNLKWSYKDAGGNEIYRNNPVIYKDAVQKIFTVMKRFQLKRPDAPAQYLNPEDLDRILELFETFTEDDGEVRHRKWLEKIKEGHFSFGAEDAGYPCGLECSALGEENGDGQYRLSPAFFNSDWKMFQDALRDHHYFLQRRLFPQYGLCIA